MNHMPELRNVERFMAQFVDGSNGAEFVRESLTAAIRKDVETAVEEARDKARRDVELDAPTSPPVAVQTNARWAGADGRLYRTPQPFSSMVEAFQHVLRMGYPEALFFVGDAIEAAAAKQAAKLTQTLVIGVIEYDPTRAATEPAPPPAAEAPAAAEAP